MSPATTRRWAAASTTCRTRARASSGGGEASSPAVLVDGLEVRVLEVPVELALAELVLAARLGDEGDVGVRGRVVAQGLGDEDLPGRVGQVLLGADLVADAHVVVVDHAGQVV